MESIAAFKRARPGPFPKPLRVKVVAVASAVEYGSEGRRLMNFSVADSGSFCKAVCFDEKKFAVLEEGCGVVLRNIIAKNEEIVVTKQSQVFRCQVPEVDVDTSLQARDLIRPRAPEVICIKDAKRSPQKVRVSVRGLVTNDKMTSNVMVKNRPVPVRNITVKDESDTVTLALWREAVNADVRPGDYVEISHVVTNTYQSEVTLSTTQYSVVQKTSAPEMEKTEEFVGVCRGDLESEMFGLDIGTIICENQKLEEHLGCSMEAIDSKFPCSLKFVFKGDRIVRFLDMDN